MFPAPYHERLTKTREERTETPSTPRSAWKSVYIGKLAELCECSARRGAGGEEKTVGIWKVMLNPTPREARKSTSETGASALSITMFKRGRRVSLERHSMCETQGEKEHTGWDLHDLWPPG